MRERWLEAVPFTAFTADGQEDGVITISDTSCFKVKAYVIIKSDTQTIQRYEIKRVLSKTQMIIGPENQKITARSDMSLFLLADNAVIEMPEQERRSIPPADYERASYEEEPTVAKRVVGVDKHGDIYSLENPFPVRISDGDVNIGTVNAEIEVQLSRQDNNPDTGDVHDSVRLGNQDYELSYTANDDESKAAADVNVLNKLIDIPHDDIEVVQFTADGDPEIIEIREGGTLKRTLTLSYNTDGEFERVVRT